VSLPTEKLYTWQRGTDVPFRTRVSMGKVVDARPVFVFGFNPDVQATEETIWDHGGVYTYPASAIQMTISSSDVTTNAVVSIVGLGAGYVEQTELITLNGQTPVTTVNSYLRINGMSALTGTVAGSIYLGAGVVTTGVPATVYARIINGNNRTEMGMFTVPDGYEFYFDRGDVSHASDSTNAYITARLMYRLPDLLFQTGAKVTLNNSRIDFQFEYPLLLPAGTDLQTRAICSKSQANAVTSSLQGLLVKTEIF
jgi:hypothetical protein